MKSKPHPGNCLVLSEDSPVSFLVPQTSFAASPRVRVLMTSPWMTQSPNALVSLFFLKLTSPKHYTHLVTLLSKNFQWLRP